MKRYRPVLLFMAATLCFGLFITSLLRDDTRRGARTQMNISVVLYGEGTERWTSMEQGLRQACGVLEITPPLVNIAATPEEQISLIQREIENGAQGILVAASDSALLQQYLEGLTPVVEVVLVETGAGEELRLVGPDDAEMGRSLAQSLAGESAVVVLEQNLHRDSVRRRHKALCDELDALGVSWQGVPFVSEWQLRQQNEGGMPIVVALDTETLEAAIDAAETLGGDETVYGIGGSDKIVHALENGVVRSLCFPNEFNTGYLGMLQLARQMGRRDMSAHTEVVDFVMVQKETLYDPDNERLLFPIIQ